MKKNKAAPGKLKENKPSYESLKAQIAPMGSVVLAFSGGVDSSLLLAAARDALSDKVLAVTAVSPSYPARERDQAINITRLLGARQRLIKSNELDNPAYRQNPPNRCYYCKLELFKTLAEIAKQEGFNYVIDGSNHDDRFDFRPGSQAALEFGVRSPLAELGLTKNQVRQMARERGLPNWNEPAFACLASRIPYGQEISPERLERVDRAEQAIRELGFKIVRVRDHNELARIELEAREIKRAALPKTRSLLLEAVKNEGFLFVCLDLVGYRCGSLNEVLPPAP